MFGLERAPASCNWPKALSAAGWVTFMASWTSFVVTEGCRNRNGKTRQTAAAILGGLSPATFAEFRQNQTAQDFSRAGEKLSKHVYDYVVTDSKIERSFVTELDTSNEVAVYAGPVDPFTGPWARPD